jgi:hypothetical protein
MCGLERFPGFGGVCAVCLCVSAGFFNQPQHGIRQRTGIIVGDDLPNAALQRIMCIRIMSFSDHRSAGLPALGCFHSPSNGYAIVNNYLLTGYRLSIKTHF